jgi:hypothetical protein
MEVTLRRCVRHRSLPTLSETIPRSVRPDFVEDCGGHSSSVRQIATGGATHQRVHARIAIVAKHARTTNDSMGRRIGDCRIFEIQLTVRRWYQE